MFALALALSVLIGVTLGLLGGGGSILTTPLLIYVVGMEPKTAIATSLLVVCVTSVAGMAQHARRGNVEWRTGLVFGIAGMVGAYAGGFVTQWIPDKVLMGLFAGLMVVTALAMLRGRKAVDAAGPQPVPKTLLIGLLVGAVTGLLGAGGGFVIVPALALLGGLPMPKAIGTSLLVIALNTLAGFAGHVTHATVDYGLAASLSAAAVVGSFLGSALSSRVKPAVLRRGFAFFVLAMGCFVLYQQVF